MIMLLGDGTDATISVSDMAGLLSCDLISVLDIDELCQPSDLVLVWNMLRKCTKKRKIKTSTYEAQGVMDVTETCIESMLTKEREGRISLVITGQASEHTLACSTSENNSSIVLSKLRKNLYQFAVFA